MENVTLRFSAIKKWTGLSRSAIYLHIARGNFPKQISLGVRSVGWIKGEIEAWLSNQIAKSRGITYKEY